MAMNAISELLNDPQGVASLQEETKQNRQIVAKRAAIFLKEAQDAGLHPYPYTYGFFVTLALPKAAEVSAKLVAQDIYLAPIQANALRIALCSLPTEKVYGLAKKIKEAL
jgi:aspartate/tyrosine/aromatic aminotransferase